ncbi:MAG TPA: hypothetical protein VEY12_12750 [Thermoplasmata archaeon]|nr:hypothetical protein [Thermoplasmata archaeon]
MARVPVSIIVAFVLPLVLILVNLIWHVGGILVLILLLIWIGLGVFFLTPEDRPTP